MYVFNGLGVESAASVLNAEHEIVAFGANAYVCVLRFGVARDVGNGFLNDTEDNALHDWREAEFVDGAVVEFDREAGAAAEIF
jgi:hypothetical protein